MKKLLIVVDMQNDFVTGSLGSKMAEKIVPNVSEKIEVYRKNGDPLLFTRDTHQENYLETQEGQYLPVKHCIEGTDGHSIVPRICIGESEILDKPNFGSIELAKKVAEMKPDEIELCGLCTDICVVSNALILKAYLPEIKVIVDADCCAGVREESHNAALMVMKMCQVDVRKGDEPYV